MLNLDNLENKLQKGPQGGLWRPKVFPGLGQHNRIFWPDSNSRMGYYTVISKNLRTYHPKSRRCFSLWTMLRDLFQCPTTHLFFESQRSANLIYRKAVWKCINTGVHLFVRYSPDSCYQVFVLPFNPLVSHPKLIDLLLHTPEDTLQWSHAHPALWLSFPLLKCSIYNHLIETSVLQSFIPSL